MTNPCTVPRPWVSARDILRITLYYSESYSYQASRLQIPLGRSKIGLSCGAGQTGPDHLACLLLLSNLLCFQVTYLDFVVRIPVLAIERDVHIHGSHVASTLERRYSAPDGYGTLFPQRKGHRVASSHTGMVKTLVMYYFDRAVSHSLDVLCRLKSFLSHSRSIELM